MSTTQQAVRTARVVVVEDSADVRFLLVTSLDWTGGIEVVGEAGKAKEALELVARTQPDVVVVDLDLPGRNGFWLLPRIAEAAPGAKAVVVTGDQRADVRERAERAGASAVLSKADAHATLADVVADLSR